MNRSTLISVLFVILFIVSAANAEAANVSVRIMPSPPTPEADFADTGVSGWDGGVGYGHLWLKDYDSATLDGVVVGALYRGVIGRRVGYTIAPIFGGAYFGDFQGIKAESYSVGTGVSFGVRLVGKPESWNLILFGGGVYSYVNDRDDNSYGSYSLNANLFGFTAGLKSQLALARYVKIIPFYVYLGGGGPYSLTTETIMTSSLTVSGGLGYNDAHLIGLDFNIYGVSAKIVADLFQEDFGSFTIWIEIGKTIRGIKSITRKQPAP